MEQSFFQSSQSDLFVFLEFYFMVAQNNIESLLSDLSMSKSCLNFWHNFGLNFKDDTFVRFFTNRNEIDNKNFIHKKLYEILGSICKFLTEHLSSEEKYSKFLEVKLFDYLEIMMIFLDIFTCIGKSEVKAIIDERMRYTFNQCFINFNSYSKIDLHHLLEALYEKVGYAFVDFRGNFIWADKYSTDVLFEQADITKINYFNLLTDYSKFIIRNKYGDAFYDFKNEQTRIKTYTYSINIIKEDELLVNKTDNFFSKLFNNLNNTKTLVSRASTILLQNYEDNKPMTCILLETKLSPFRQNFDYFHWRCYLN